MLLPFRWKTANAAVSGEVTSTQHRKAWIARNAAGTAVELVAPALSLPTTASVRAAVIAGAGPAVLSELAVADDIAAGRLRAIEIDGLQLARDLRAVWRGAPQPPTGPARELLKLAAASARHR